jgi:hypothetical protein
MMARGYTEKEMRLAAKKMRLQHGVIDLIITECRQLRSPHVVNKNALSHSVSNPVICCESCQYYTEYECMLEYKCCINHDKFAANE